MASVVEEIVVVGKRDSSGFVYGFETFQRRSWGGGYVPRTDDTAYNSFLAVNVSLTNSANRVRVEAAARALIIALTRVQNLLAAVNPNISVTFHGRTATVGDFLADMANTQYSIVDYNNFQNTGLGAASRGSTNTDILYYGVIEQYSSQIYGSNGEGLNILVLHELGHISAAGWDFFQANLSAYNATKAAGFYDGTFYPSDWSKNVEAFANDVAFGIANGAGIDVQHNGSDIVPGNIRNSVDPLTLNP